MAFGSFIFVGSCHICRFELKHELMLDCTVINICQQSTGNRWQRKIPREYHRHLIWIQQESTGDSQRSRWLKKVIDVFVEELQEVPSDFSSWRSAVLHPLLMRAFYEMPEDNPKAITAEAAAWLRTGSPKLLLENWLQFYFEIDPINEEYDARWARIKSKAFGQGDGDENAEQVPGILTVPTCKL